MKLPAVITSKSNERVKALREGFRGKASRPGELVSLEGPKLLEEARRSGLDVEACFVSEGLESAHLETAYPGIVVERLHVLRRDVFEGAVETRAPQGIAALVRIPAERTVPLETLQGASLLVEGMQDPGNLGTLLRSAEALGAEAVFLAGETVNPWSPKVVRASAGSVFRLPVVRLRSLEDLAGHGLGLYAAVTQQAAAGNLLETRLRFPCVLMVGHEGAGLTAQAVDLATGKVWIPCATESLNAGVAGSLLLYEAMRQRGGL